MIPVVRIPGLARIEVGMLGRHRLAEDHGSGRAQPRLHPVGRRPDLHISDCPGIAQAQFRVVDDDVDVGSCAAAASPPPSSSSSSSGTGAVAESVVHDAAAALGDMLRWWVVQRGVSASSPGFLTREYLVNVSYKPNQTGIALSRQLWRYSVSYEPPRSTTACTARVTEVRP